MLTNHFYHEKIRKAVSSFGTLFNNIYVIRKNSTGWVLNQTKVPLSYAPKRSFLDRIRENADLDTQTKVAIKLPRMSFEIVSFTYDPARQLAKSNSFQQAGSTVNLHNRVYSSVPYIISFQLNVYAKAQDDALQIVEQIVPYFNPNYTLTMKPFSDHPDIKEDIPITITGVDFSDDYEGALEQRRTIIYTLSFDMKINMYGPITENNIIRSSINNIYNQNAGLLDSDVKIETLTVTTNPADVSVDSDFGFTTTIDLAYDDSA